MIRHLASRIGWKQLFTRVRHLWWPQRYIFIFGCQRSGTTIISDTLGQLPDSVAYPEINNELTDQDKCELPLYTIRLNPLRDVRQKLRSNPHRLIIIKPLVESQQAKHILEYFDNAVALWIYRNYRDAVKSMAVKWGVEKGVPHLSSILRADPNNWRSQHLSEDVRVRIHQLHREGITDVDGWALFWYARNSLFFSQQLQSHRRCRLLNYEKLVSDPTTMNSILAQLGLQFDSPEFHSVLNELHHDSVNKGAEIVFSSDVEPLLEDMQRNLDGAEQAQNLPVPA